MYVTPCPKCGRIPVIHEGIRIKNYKNGIRRRFCLCPNYCSVIPRSDELYTFSFEFDGEGDDNAIFKEWNKAVKCYLENVEKPWFERTYEWR